MFENRYEYYAGKSGTNETTGLVRKEEYYLKNITAPQGSIEYEYDANGNVTEIKNLLDTGKNISYEYDSLNRLTKETNLAIGSEWRYTYDNGGNITRKEEYNPSTGALVSSRDYGYGDSYWKDQLTSWGSYGTSSFAYDSSGNPTKYKDSTLTWEGKRPVKYAESDTKYTDLSYDGNGMLTGIMQVQNYVIWGGAVATNVYSKEITRDGDRILSEKVTNIDGTLLTNEVKNIKYCYDADGICGMFVDGNQYFFRRNIFGDVTEIYDKNGVKKAEYAYDAWGTCHLMLDTDGVGSLNPFRYRGYYMVSCIGLYYLTTRFYDYTTGRFLNADVPSVGMESGFNIPEGCNLYSYCLNNPISYVDPTGYFPILSLILGLTALVGMGLTIGGVASDNNIMTAIGLTMIAVPALISGGMAIAAGVGGATFLGIIGGGTCLAGLGTGLFASAEYQEAFTGNNWILNTGMSEEWYNGLMISTAALATIGTISCEVLGSIGKMSTPQQMMKSLKNHPKRWKVVKQKISAARGKYKGGISKYSNHVNRWTGSKLGTHSIVRKGVYIHGPHIHYWI